MKSIQTDMSIAIHINLREVMYRDISDNNITATERWSWYSLVHGPIRRQLASFVDQPLRTMFVKKSGGEIKS